MSYLNSVQWLPWCCLWNEIKLNNEYDSRMMIGDGRIVVESLHNPLVVTKGVNNSPTKENAVYKGDKKCWKARPF